MREPQKKEFQNRIANAGRKELLLIHFDMILAEMELIELAYRAEDMDQFRSSIQLTAEMIKKMVESLDFSYEISPLLMQNYQQINEKLIKIKQSYSLEELPKAISVIRALREVFAEIEYKEEGPLIQNSETVYAGLTYGKNNQLTESVDYQKRGFKA